MPRIPITEAQPGQVLTRAAVTRTGTVMVQPGTALTEALIERLASIGIDMLTVEGAVAGQKPSAEQGLRELEERFAGLEGDPWMMELKAILIHQLGGTPSPADHG